MKPATYDFTYQAGDTVRLRTMVVSRNVRSGAIMLRGLAPDVVEWTVYWPGAIGKAVDTSAPAVGQTPAGRLKVDPRTAVVTHPMTTADLMRVPAGARVPFKIIVINSEGVRVTHGVGTIGWEGLA